MVEIMRGIRVLEVASWTYVPVAGAVLAEWGADVIKVEHPETGDPQRGLVTSGLVPLGGVAHMVELPNRGKRSIGLDMKSAEGHDLLLRLAETADVFLTNFLPNQRKKLRIDVDDIRTANPAIVFASGSAHGPRGAEANAGGYDNSTFWARSGAADTASPDELGYPVTQPGAAYGDVTGGLTLAGGISAALLHRERTGEALTVDGSLLSQGAWSLGATLAGAAAFGMARGPRYKPSDAPNAMVNSYQTSDGRFVFLVMLQTDRFWPKLVTAFGKPELADDPRFADHAARMKHHQRGRRRARGPVRRPPVRRGGGAAEFHRRCLGTGAAADRRPVRPADRGERVHQGPQGRQRHSLQAGARAAAVQRRVRHPHPGAGPRRAHRRVAHRTRPRHGPDHRAEDLRRHPLATPTPAPSEHVDCAIDHALTWSNAQSTRWSKASLRKDRYDMSDSLGGVRAIVTGGASGMGAGIVRAFAAHGAQVISLDIQAGPGAEIAEKATAAGPGSAAFIAADVSDKASVDAAFAAAAEALGGLDVLVHAAGIAPGSPAESIAVEDWDNVLAVNARGTFLTNQAAFRYLRESGGRIINFASSAGVAGLPNKAHYSASKGAVVAWTRTVAKEWGKYGITVNMIAPTIATPMYAKTRSLMTPEQLAALDATLKAEMPIDGKLGDIDRDLVPLMVFLAGPGARFITGQIFSVDGGILMVR